MFAWRDLRRDVARPKLALCRIAIWDWVVGFGIAVYVILFAARTISAYTSGTSLFDLATYAQGFWNALGNPPFFYSLEGGTSRFARHFSPFFYVLLPFYWLRPDPTTLLALQALALGLGAMPVYLLAQNRLGKPLAAAFALAYLANPAVHDINIQNDFHEIAFSLPLLLLTFYLGLDGRPLLYFGAMLLALSTREEVAVTAAAFGVYLALFGWRRRLGLITIAVSLIWLAIVVGWAMPALNVTGQIPLAEGYGYLGNSPVAILRGMLDHPSLAVREITRPPKLAYVFWLMEPVAFLPVVAPEILVAAVPALLEVLLSTNPLHYRIFERYAAPIVPVIFLAAILGSTRIGLFLKAHRVGYRWTGLPLGFLIIGGTVVSQIMLRKVPTEIQFSPDVHGALALQVAASLPQNRSVVVEDHRLLPHLANRRFLYALSAQSPMADYVVFDRKRQPITNVPLSDLPAAESRYLSDPSYLTLRCDDGIFVLGRTGVARQDGMLPPGRPPSPVLANFGSSIALTAVEVDQTRARPGGEVAATLTWQAIQRVGTDYQVFVQLIDATGHLRAQHDSAPQDQLCVTSTWTPGLVVRDSHRVTLPASLPPGRYELRIGLYSLADLKRLPVSGGTATTATDYVSFPLIVRTQ